MHQQDDSGDDEESVSLVEYRRAMTGTIVGSIFQVIQAEREEHGNRFSNELLLSIVCSCITTMLLASMRSAKDDPDQSNYDMAKSAIEQMVATSFEGAFMASGVDKDSPEFICTVRKVQAILSKAVH